MLSLAHLLCFSLAVFVPAVVVQYCKSFSISFASLCTDIIIRSPCWCLEEQDQRHPSAQSSLCLSPLQEEGLQTLLFRWNKFNCLFHWNWKWVVHFVQWRRLWLLCSCFVVSDWLQSNDGSCITPCSVAKVEQFHLEDLLSLSHCCLARPPASLVGTPPPKKTSVFKSTVVSLSQNILFRTDSVPTACGQLPASCHRDAAKWGSCCAGAGSMRDGGMAGGLEDYGSPFMSVGRGVALE